MSTSLKQGDACPYCPKGIMVNADGNTHALRCDKCGKYWYYSHSDGEPKTQ